MMLLKNGYQLIEIEPKGDPDDYRLLLRKSLAA
jgi:hypothetical protein